MLVEDIAGWRRLRAALGAPTRFGITLDIGQYLLESVQGGERFGRYSFIGLPAQARIVVRGHRVLVIHGESVAEEADSADPLEFVRQYLARYRAAPLPGCRASPAGSSAASVTKQCGPSNRSSIAGRRNPSRSARPTSSCCSPRRSRSSTTSPASSTSSCTPIRAIRTPTRTAGNGCGSCSRRCASRSPSPARAGGRAPAAVGVRRGELPRGGGEGEALCLRRRHHAGADLAAAVAPFAGEPLALYRSLRTLNPSPYMFFFDFRDFHVVGASPEILVR